MIPLDEKNSGILNSGPLSLLMILTWSLCWFSMRLTKLITCCLASDLVFINVIHVYLLQSSTAVKKYEWPCKDWTARGPQISK